MSRSRRVRAFLAVDVPSRELPRLEALSRALHGIPGVKPVDPGLWHITIQFFGDLDPAEVTRIDGAISQMASPLEPFNLGFRGVGAFPSPARPQVLWAGCPSGRLVDLADRSRAVLGTLGHRADKRFEPHLTLGRVRVPADSRLLERLLAAHRDDEFGSVEVSELRLKRSELRPGGPLHSVVRAWPFGQAAVGLV